MLREPDLAACVSEPTTAQTICELEVRAGTVMTPACDGMKRGVSARASYLPPGEATAAGAPVWRRIVASSWLTGVWTTRGVAPQTSLPPGAETPITIVAG